MKIFSNTNIGLVRNSNQDAYAFGIVSDNCCWSVVCDGMGGANGGNVASEIAVNTAQTILKEKMQESLTEDELIELSSVCISKANTNVFAKAFDEPSLKGMGTTMIVTLVNGDDICISHVGDSRVYRFSDDKVVQITQDHSYVQELVNRGEITKETARVHPHRNIITRSVGIHSTVEIDSALIKANAKDLIILCSDGLSSYLTEEDFERIIKDNEIENLCDVLIEFALKKGGADNITVSVISI
ncbi:MAG: Stp1/IreP family PP2C-type Ser/Thr phosphatase [Clostridia bacterium]